MPQIVPHCLSYRALLNIYSWVSCSDYYNLNSHCKHFLHEKQFSPPLVFDLEIHKTLEYTYWETLTKQWTTLNIISRVCKGDWGLSTQETFELLYSAGFTGFRYTLLYVEQSTHWSSVLQIGSRWWHKNGTEV